MLWNSFIIFHLINEVPPSRHLGCSRKIPVNVMNGRLCPWGAFVLTLLREAMKLDSDKSITLFNPSKLCSVCHIVMLGLLSGLADSVAMGLLRLRPRLGLRLSWQNPKKHWAKVEGCAL